MTDLTFIYRAYLLRLWRTLGSEWRASLEDPKTGRRRGFATLALLMEFLEQRSDGSMPAEVPPGTADEGEGESAEHPPSAAQD
jgi:hypothetical protein